MCHFESPGREQGDDISAEVAAATEAAKETDTETESPSASPEETPGVPQKPPMLSEVSGNRGYSIVILLFEC